MAHELAINLDIIPQFSGASAAVSDAAVGLLPDMAAGLGTPEFIFFITTYIYEITNGEGGGTMLNGFF